MRIKMTTLIILLISLTLWLFLILPKNERKDIKPAKLYNNSIDEICSLKADEYIEKIYIPGNSELCNELRMKFYKECVKKYKK